MPLNLHGLRTVVYTTTDLSKTKDWYRNILGIEPYFDEVFYVGFNVGGYELGIHPAEETPEGGYGGTAYWGVDDVEKAYNELLSAGATPMEKPADVGGGIVVASVRDPWGNPFGVIYNPHFSLA
jgi:lactoylglutathione lyase